MKKDSAHTTKASLGGANKASGVAGLNERLSQIYIDANQLVVQKIRTGCVGTREQMRGVVNEDPPVEAAVRLLSYADTGFFGRTLGMMRYSCLMTSILFLCGASAAEDMAPLANDAIRDAIVLLEERNAKSGDKEAQAEIQAAITALERLMQAGEEKNAAGEEEPGVRLKASVFRRRFRGFAGIKDGQVAFTYDFRRQDQLGDFTPDEARIEIQRSGNRSAAATYLRVSPAVRITHKARFKTVTVAGDFKVENPGPAVSSTAFFGLTGGLEVCTSADNGSTFKLALNGKEFITGDVGAESPLGNSGSFKLLYKGKELGHKFVGPDSITSAYKHNLEFTADLRPILTTTAIAKLANNKAFQLSDVVDPGDAGAVFVSGGKGGVLIRSLTITGVPDDDWVRGLDE